MKKVSASILSADWLHLGDELYRAENAGCDCVHIDVTDGHFVSNLTMGMDITRAVCKASNLRADVHFVITSYSIHYTKLYEGVDKPVFGSHLYDQTLVF